MRTRFIFSVIFLVQLLISCKEDKRELLPAKDLLNISYGTNAFNKMDIYLPQNRTRNTRTIILIHGGYWYAGDKSELVDYAKYFRNQGFACVTMNYRLTRTKDNYINPAQINDVGKVVDYMSSKSGEFHISSGKFGLMGVSAGAHIALLYTYSSNTNEKVKTVISVAGPTNFTTSQNISVEYAQVLAWLIGATPDEDPGAYITASPITHVKASSKPTFLIHGKLDGIIPYQQSIDLQTKLNSFKIRNELRLLDNTGHEFKDPVIVAGLLADGSSWFNENIK